MDGSQVPLANGLGFKYIVFIRGFVVRAAEEHHLLDDLGLSTNHYQCGARLLQVLQSHTI